MHGELRYAGVWPRFLAQLIDLLFFCGVFFPVTRAVKGVWLMQPGDHTIRSGMFITDPLCLGFLVFMFLYAIVLEGLLGATLGKYVVGLKVLTVDGATPGIGKGLVRNVLRIVDALPSLNILGVVLVLRSPERARFGDRIANTRVVFRAR